MGNRVAHCGQWCDEVEVQQFSPQRGFTAGEGADHPAPGDGDDRVESTQHVDCLRDAGVEHLEVGDVTFDADRTHAEFGA
ncbi:hypothetical protein A5653_07315 [Mycobacterium colombiense]|nr:hypothetical protein [Mycobacterium colombiense]OBK58580.1 hypothetical protein A5653_07315 [Mycobacterium colombiense]